MPFVIYCHTNTNNQKRYVGQTRHTMEHRWREHMKCARRGDSGPFHRAIRKYGADAFSHEVLETCDTQEAANEAEIKWIAAFETTREDVGYNLDTGGRAAGTHPDTRRKHREWWAALSAEERTALVTSTTTFEERSERARRTQRGLNEEQKVAQRELCRALGKSIPKDAHARRNKMMWDSFTPEERAEHIKNASAWISEMTPEERREHALLVWERRRENSTPEERFAVASEAAKQRAVVLGPEKRSEIARKRQAAKTAEERSAQVSKGRAKMTPEARRAASQKGNATRGESIRKSWILRKQKQQDKSE